MAEQKNKIAALQMELRKVEDLRPAEYNPRKTLKPGDDEYEKLKASIQSFGYVDPIIVNRDGTVIGGHQRLNVLIDLGFSEVEVAVVDLNKSDEKALNIALNKISGEWDEEKLAAIFSELKLEGYDTTVTGFEKDEIADILAGIVTEEEEQAEKYSQKAEAPIYEITGDDVSVSDLFDASKYHELIRDIESDTNISRDEREFLKLAAARHIVFNYRNIAEYYAAAEPGMQGLMEDSALVIIDVGQAIQNGFANLSQAAEEIMNGEESDDA
jgi:hypothetical protein